MTRKKNKPTADELEDQEGDELENTENESTEEEEGEDDEADGRKFTQKELDEKISKRLKSEKARIKREVSDEIRAELKEEFEAEEAEKSGDLQKLLDREKRKVEKLQDELDEIRGEQEKTNLEQLRAAIAKKEGLPDNALSFVKGEDEESIRESVKGLAALVGVKEAPDGDQGKGSHSNSSRKRRSSQDDEAREYEKTGYWRQDIQD